MLSRLLTPDAYGTDAEPSESEALVYEEVRELLEEAHAVLQSIRDYCGAGAEIRLAISEPRNEEYQRMAVDALIPLVKKLQSFFLFSQRLGKLTIDAQFGRSVDIVIRDIFCCSGCRA